MGLNTFKPSTCSCPKCSSTASTPTFEIARIKQIGDWTILLAHYPAATNYEGRKILVFNNTTIEELHVLRHLDPHFCPGDTLGLQARFRPTESGWAHAVEFVRAAIAATRR